MPDWGVLLEVVPYATEQGYWGLKRDLRESLVRFSIEPLQVAGDYTLQTTH